MSLQVFSCGVLLQDGADSDAQLGVLGQLLGPFLEAVDVRESDDLTTLQHQQPVIDTRLATGSQPEILVHQAGADDGGLLALDQGNRHPRMLQQEVFAEQALRQFPVGRQLTGLLHQRMNPGDAAGDVGVFDAMTCLRVVFHNLACAAAAQRVNLEEDGGTGAGDADAVFLDEGLDHHRVDDRAEEGDEVGVLVKADAAVHDKVGDGAEGLRFGLLEPDGMVVSPVFSRLQVRMVGEELLRGVVVATAGLVVAAAYGFVERVAILVYVEREALFPSTGWTGVASGYAFVFL